LAKIVFYDHITLNLTAGCLSASGESQTKDTKDSCLLCCRHL